MGYATLHKKRLRTQRKEKEQHQKEIVRAKRRTIIGPESVAKVEVIAPFTSGIHKLFVERKISHVGEHENAYRAPDSLINQDRPILIIANFAKQPLIIGEGDILGIAHDPLTWLDKRSKYSPED